MSSLNKVQLIGRLGKDPEVRETDNYTVCTLNVATDESYTDRDNKRHEKTEWHKVVLWGIAAENAKRNLRKGSLIYVEGSLQTRKWRDSKNNDRYTTEVKAFTVKYLKDWGNDSPDGGGSGHGGGGGGPGEDEVPF